MKFAVGKLVLVLRISVDTLATLRWLLIEKKNLTEKN